MRAIQKAPEPRRLAAHRSRTHADYDNFQDKETLRQALVTEQRGLCCYCMDRIRPERSSMKIEHWKCRAHNQDQQLNYRNLLGACLGGDGKPASLQHCDTSKGDRDIRWNPANPSHHIQTRVRYESDGSIRADGAEFDDQLNSVLNLNLPFLKNNRKDRLDVVLHWWRSQKTRIGGPALRDRLVRKKERELRGDGELRTYCQVTVWWLEWKLANMAL